MSRSLYNNPNLDKFIGLSENQNFEKKSARIQGKDLAAEFTAFANSSIEGGLVVVGIDNDMELSGINNVGQEKINKLICAHKIYCPEAVVEHKEIKIKNKKGEDDRLLLFYVRYSLNKVIKLNSGEALERIADETHKMSIDKIKQMEYDKGQVDFEKELIPGFDISKLNQNLIREFIKAWTERDGLDAEPSLEDAILQKGFGQQNDGKIIINHAGLLMFYDHPEEVLPGARIRFLKYEGFEVKTGVRSNIIKDKYFDGSLPVQISLAAEMIKAQTKEFSFLEKNGKFITVPEYPEFAWYEAVVNAIAHRAYNLKNANIFIRIFDDRIEVQSPGNLPGIVTVQNIYKENFPRNPILMQAMLYLGFVKSASEGVDRIKDELEALGLPAPVFNNDISAVQFTITLQNNFQNRILKIDGIEKLNRNILKAIDGDERKIIYYLLKHQSGATGDFKNATDKERTTVIRKLRRLEELKIIKRTKQIGPDVKYELTTDVFSDPDYQQAKNDENIDENRQQKLL